MPQRASESSPVVTLPQTEKAADKRSGSSRPTVDRRAAALRLKTVQGIVYTAGNDSLASLAVETAEGTVMILIGAKAAALRAHEHQKVSLTGFWRPAADGSARDTLEVADYALLRE